MLWSAPSALFASSLNFQADLILGHKQSLIAGIAYWFNHLNLIYPIFALHHVLGLCLLASKPLIFLIVSDFFLVVFHSALCSRYFWGFSARLETYVKFYSRVTVWILCFWGRLLSISLCSTLGCPLAFPAYSALSCQYFSRHYGYFFLYSD